MIPAGCPLQLSHWTKGNCHQMLMKVTNSVAHGVDEKSELPTLELRLNQLPRDSRALVMEGFLGKLAAIMGHIHWVPSRKFPYSSLWVELCPPPPNNSYVEVLNLGTAESV